MKKKGFTLVELLVVIAIIAMLLAILMPALNKVRQIAYRVVCSSNCSGIGKAMLTYCNDYQESFPKFGSATTIWGKPGGNALAGSGGITSWDQDISTNVASPSLNTSATIGASLFLLVKYSDVPTGSFVCKAASNGRKFDLQSCVPTNTTKITDVTLCWDFGPSVTSTTWKYTNRDYCNYAYQQPYCITNNGGDTIFPLTAAGSAGLAILADSNPWVDPTAGTVPAAASSTTGPYQLQAVDLGLNTDGSTNASGSVNKDKVRLANSKNHNQDGQNVLYLDGHATFEQAPNVGIEQDNIYLTWGVDTSTGSATINGVNKQCGGTMPPTNTSKATALPQDAADSFLAQ